MAKKQFKAESKRLLDMMINSIYTHKEIFLREIISNSSDALDKLCYKSLEEGGSGTAREDLFIKVSVDKENRVIKVSDNGIGIPHDKLAELQSKLSSVDSVNLTEGIGILNTNARIRLVYGDECGVHIDSRENEGTTVIVIMHKSK